MKNKINCGSERVNDRSASPRAIARPDLSWILEDVDWTEYAYNPVMDIGELVTAIESALDGVPLEIQIGADIEMDGTVPLNGIEPPDGVDIAIKLTSVAGDHYSISAMNARRLFSVYNSSLYLENITLKDGAHTEGGAISMDVGTLVMQQDSVISDSNASSGGGINMYFDSRAVLMDNALIEDCSAYENGGAVLVDVGNSIVLMDDAVIRRSEAGNHGGGVMVSGASFFMLDRSKITECECTIVDLSFGGGLDMYDSTALIADNAEISGCKVKLFGGGMAAIQNSRYEIVDDASITGNYSLKDGGGIYQYNNVIGILKNRASISQNTVGRAGGGIFLETDEVISFEDAEDIRIEGNTAPLGGGGIYPKPLPNPNLFIPSGVSFIDNRADNGCVEPSDAVKAVEAATISTTVFTSPFTFAYNNFDIALPAADCLAGAPGGAADIVGRVLMCCRKDIDGLFTAVLTDSDGNVEGEATNDARGRFEFSMPPLAAPGEYLYTLAQKIDVDGVRQDKRKVQVLITVDADGNGKVSYPHGRPLFLNFCKR